MSGSRLFALPKKVSGTNKLQPLMWQTNCSLADRILRKRGTASHVSRFVSTGNVIEGETLMLNGAVRLQVGSHGRRGRRGHPCVPAWHCAVCLLARIRPGIV